MLCPGRGFHCGVERSGRSGWRLYGLLRGGWRAATIETVWRQANKAQCRVWPLNGWTARCKTSFVVEQMRLRLANPCRQWYSGGAEDSFMAW